MKNRKKFVVYAWMVLLLAAVSLSAWERPLRIAGGDGNGYLRPNVKFGPSGKAYIVYESRNIKTGRNDIFMRSYDGKSVSAVMNVTEGNPFARTPYYPDLAVSRNEQIWVAWMEYQRGATDVAQYVKARFFDGKKWGAIESIGSLGGIKRATAEDLRVAVDDNNDLFIVCGHTEARRNYYFHKYWGEKAVAKWPLFGPAKHPDIAVDENYVHITWQHLTPKDYGIMYQRRENKENGAWAKTVDIMAYHTQRPRIDLDNNGNPHICFWEDRGADRRLWNRAWDGNLTNRNKTTLISTPEYEVYHFLDYSIMNNHHFATWQAGNYYTGANGRVYYSELKADSKVWDVQKSVEAESPVLVSNAQTWDGKIVGIASSTSTNGVILVLSEKLNINILPQAVISADKEEIFWDETVNFSASGSTDADGSIVRYQWRVIPDKITLDGATVSYKFDKSYGSVKVRLTVTDSKGGMGTAEKTINVKALYTAVSTASKQLIQTLIYNREGYVIKWVPNAKNDAAGYNIVGYKISRKEAGGEYQEIGSVGAARRIFADVNVEAGKTYSYAVSAVDDQGHKSPYNNF